MACDNRQLGQQEREAAFNQNRTGVSHALRPFKGTPTPESIADYLNREVFPVLSRAREAVNEVYLQVADNAPSANPLAYYFSVDTANADPTIGRVRLDQATQNTATTIRVAQANGRRQDVAPWLDVMAGSATSPLGVVTLTHAINPARFIRFNLTAMVDQGAYWDLTVSPVESSHDNPFVDGDQMAIGFIAGVASGGTTVSPGAITPIANETLLANISGGVAAPTAVPFATIDSTSVIWDSASDTFQRAALTGFAAATQNSNATTSAEPIITYSASANMSAERVLSNGTNTVVDLGTANQAQIDVDDFPLSGLADQATETFLGNFTASPAPPTARAGTSVAGAGLTYTAGGTLAVGSSTSITVNADDVQRSALTGDITAALNVNTTAFRSFVGLSVLARAANTSGVPTELTAATANHLLKVNAAGTALVFEGLALAAFPTIADDTFLANISGGTAVPSAVALTTLAGAGLTGGADAILNVGAGTRITVNANDVQLATGAADSFLMNATAGVATADYRAGSSVAGAGLTYTTGGTLAVGAGTNVTVNANDVAVDDFPLSGLADIADQRVVGNVSGGAAPPVALTSLQIGTFLTVASPITKTSGTLGFDLTAIDSTSIVVNAGTLERAALTGAIAAGQNGNGTVFAGFRDNGTLETGRTFANFLSTTSITALITADAGNDEHELTFQRAALTGDVTASANSNATTIANDAVTYAKLQNVAGFSVVGKATTGSGDAADITAAADQILRRSGSGDLGFGTLVTNNIGNDQVTYAKIQNVSATDRLLGRDTTGAGDIEEISVGAGLTFTGAQAIACLTAGDAQAGIIEIAIQSEMEAGADPTRAVTPARQHFHPSACKAWGQFDGDGVGIFSSYDVTSITDSGVGLLTVNLTTGLVSGTAVVSAMKLSTETTDDYVVNTTNAGTGTSFVFNCRKTSASTADPRIYDMVAFGDFA